MKILVIEARGLATGFLGCYGNEWVGTPCLDRLAAEGIVFDQHIAHWPDPGDDLPTWRRGYGGSSADLSDDLERGRIVHATLADLDDFGPRAVKVWKRQAAPDRIVWLDGPTLAPPWSLDPEMLASYFDEDDDAGEPEPEPACGVTPLSLDQSLRLHDTYAAVVTYFDGQLEHLIEHLDDDTLVCVTARCGLALGEHGVVGPARAWLHQEVVHLPLVLRQPRGVSAGLRLAGLTQPVDLLPTLLDALGQPASTAPGIGLGPCLRQELDGVRPYACAALMVGDSREWLLRTPDWALLVPQSAPADDPPRRTQLFIKPDDRWEVNDVGPGHSELAEGLEATLGAFMAANQGFGPAQYPPLPEGF